MRPTHAGLFHVCARSNAEEHIFRTRRDHEAGIRLLEELVASGSLRCHGFCLMPTHYHLLAWFGENQLTSSIRNLNRRYAVGFNLRHDRRGKVFDSPFTEVEVVSEEQRERVEAYIAENPSRRPWPWSSYDAPFSFVDPLAP